MVELAPTAPHLLRHWKPRFLHSFACGLIGTILSLLLMRLWDRFHDSAFYEPAFYFSLISAWYASKLLRQEIETGRARDLAQTPIPVRTILKHYYLVAILPVLLGVICFLPIIEAHQFMVGVIGIDPFQHPGSITLFINGGYDSQIYLNHLFESFVYTLPPTLLLPLLVWNFDYRTRGKMTTALCIVLTLSVSYAQFLATYIFEYAGMNGLWIGMHGWDEIFLTILMRTVPYAVIGSHLFKRLERNFHDMSARSA